MNFGTFTHQLKQGRLFGCFILSLSILGCLFAGRVFAGPGDVCPTCNGITPAGTVPTVTATNPSGTLVSGWDSVEAYLGLSVPKSQDISTPSQTNSLYVSTQPNLFTHPNFKFLPVNAGYPPGFVSSPLANPNPYAGGVAIQPGSMSSLLYQGTAYRYRPFQYVPTMSYMGANPDFLMQFPYFQNYFGAAM